MAQKTYYNPCLLNITDEFTRNEVKLGVGSIACANVPECIPRFDKAPCETVYKGGHNSFIVLGRDRDQSWLSGRAGKGMTNTGMIDIVVGRGQLLAAHNINEGKEPYEGLKEIGPSFAMDAARIYLTQGCNDIDEYFGLKSSDYGHHGFGCSAVGLKADQVRIIGRQKVAIHAGKGNWEGLDKNKGETSCMGDTINNVSIELIAGDAKSLEPMVLGNKLVAYFKEIEKRQRNIANQLFQIQTVIALESGALTALPGMAAVTVPSMKEMASGMADSVSGGFNSYLEELSRLDGDLITGPDYILSKTCFLSK